MDLKEWQTACAEARQLDIVSYLSTLGYTPAKVNNSDYWYLSPLRHEKTPSFKVNRRLNLWYDHGIGKGGNLIDFAILYKNCTVGEFLKTWRHVPILLQPLPKPRQEKQTNTESPIQIIGSGPIVSFQLQRYLHQRRIPIAMANRYCKEVHYTLSGNRYFAIGFSNKSGGFELRNPYFKGSTAPKDVTIFKKNANTLTVFEGFFDFLSFLAINQHQRLNQSNFLILNSVALFEKARPFMEQHEAIHLYLDRDATGQNCTRHAVSLSQKYQDKSSLYANYKDVNDWVMHIGNRRRTSQGLQPRNTHFK